METHSGKTAFWIQKDNKDCSGITYKETWKDVCGLAASLMAFGMKDKRIAIIGENSYEWAVSFLAAICKTGVAVALDKEYSINELKHFLNATGCSCAIFSEELEDVFWQIRNDGVTNLEMLINMNRKNSEFDIFSLQELIDEGKQMAASDNCDFTGVQATGDELCAIMLTSGTTDVAKCVNLSHTNIASEINMVSRVLNIREDKVFFSKLPFHCASECICSILLPLCMGASIDCCRGLKHNFEISSVQGYSQTESSSIVTINPYNGSAGQVLPGMKIKISNPDPKAGIGEICLAGKNIMMGYCNNPKATAEVLKDGWLYTGDMGRIDKKGHVYIAGRKENIIRAENGMNVYPEELESLLNKIPYVSDSMVWSKSSDNDESYTITAAIFADKAKLIYKQGEDYSIKGIEKLLWNEVNTINENLPFYKRINKIVLRNYEFQKNSCNKIIRWYPANKQ